MKLKVSIQNIDKFAFNPSIYNKTLGKNISQSPKTNTLRGGKKAADNLRIPNKDRHR